MDGNINIDDESEINGSLEATGNIVCGKQITIHGNVTATGEVHIGDQSKIFGHIKGNTIFFSKTATVQGTLLAPAGVLFVDALEKQVTEKVKRFETDADIVDEVKSMLE